MPLTPQSLPIQFAAGIDSKTDSKQVPHTKLLTLQNAVFTRQTSLSKRNGYQALPRLVDGGSAEYGTAVGLGSHGDELLVFADERCYSYRPSVGRMVDAGEVLSTVATEAPIARTGTDQDAPDHATNNGVTVVAWQDSRGGVRASVIEADTGRILLADTLLDANGVQPICVPCGEVLHVYWRDSSGRILCAVVNPFAPAVPPAIGVLVDSLNPANPRFDATDARAVQPTIKPSILAWADASGAWRVGYVHPSGVIGSPVTGLPASVQGGDSCTAGIAVAVDRHNGSRVAVAVGGADIIVRWLSPALVLSSSVTAVSGLVAAKLALEIAKPSGGLTTAWWAAEVAGGSPDTAVVRSGRVSESAVLVPATGRAIRGHRLASRAFWDGEHVYAFVGHEVFFFGYVALVRLSADAFGDGTSVGDAVTQVHYRSAVGQWPGQGASVALASVHAVSPDAMGLSRVHATTIAYRLQAESRDGNVFTETGLKRVVLDMDADGAYQSAEIGRGTYLASACMQHYDGARWAEAGFHTAPDTSTGVIAASATYGSGVLPTNTTYLYRLIYEEIDAQGELHRSAPSAPIVFTTTSANAKISIQIPTLRLTNRRRARIGVFRSPGNAEGTIETIPFYRVSSLDPNDGALADNRYVLNDPSVDTVAFTDNMPDDSLLAQEPLYTNGGILPNDPSPMRGDVIVSGKGRLFWTDPSDPSVVRYSQEIASETALEAPATLELRVGPTGGRIVGIGVMDGGVYVFCETAIYAFGGPGPLAAPGAGDAAFSVPELVTSDSGCVSPTSITATPVGLMFQSEKGIKLLDRTRQVIDIGAPVYAYNAQRVTRATLLPDRTHVLFLVDSGVSLLFDYERGQWSTFTNHEGFDARIVGGRYYYLRMDGRVFAETPGQYRDDNLRIPMLIETAWIKLTGYLQGWQRILWAYFIGEWKSTHALVVRYRIDYNAGYSDPVELDVDSNIDPRFYGESAYGSSTYGSGTEDTTRYQRAIHYNLPCQAIQFRIEDREPADAFGASFELSELLLIGGVLDTRAKIGAARIR